MKNRYFLTIVLPLVILLGACTEKPGLEPGNDAAPKVTLWQYQVTLPNSVDNDTRIRVTANQQTSEAFYLPMKTAEYEAQLQALGGSGLAEHVVATGTKIENPTSNPDIIVTDLQGENTIVFAAVNGGTKTISSIEFTGVDWETVVKGTYYAEVQAAKPFNPAKEESYSTELQKSTNIANLYRLKDVFGPGYSMKFKLLPDNTGTDEDGTFTMFRVEAQPTPFTYNYKGSDYPLSFRDIGYWQGNNAYATNPNYCSGLYTNNIIFFSLSWDISEGSIGYGYTFFEPEG